MPFWYPQFFRKTNEKIRLNYYDTSGRLVFVPFLEDTKKHFEINWPFTKRIDNQLKSVSIGTAVSGNWEVPCYPPLGILSPRWGLPSTGLVLRCSQTCLTLGVTWRMLLTRVFGNATLPQMPLCHIRPIFPFLSFWCFPKFPFWNESFWNRVFFLNI